MSLAATVRAAVTRPGDKVHASTPLLPAATTTLTPSSTNVWTAVSTLRLASPPRLRFATAGTPGRWWVATQSRPARRPESEPSPAQSSTRTATGVTPLATP